MRFSFTDDQRALGRGVAELLQKHCTPEYLRASARGDELWSALCEVGVVGVLAAEEHGGLGLTEIDLMLPLEEAGKAALPHPLGDVAAIAVPLLGARAEPIITGAARIAVALDGYAWDAEGSQLALVARNGMVEIVDSFTTSPVEALDPTLRIFKIEGDSGTPLVPLKDARERGALAASAQLLGVAAHLIDMTATYAKERAQFGKPIGSFQAVKHHLANALLRLEFARPVVYNAANSLARALLTRSRDVSMAKAFSSDAATFAARIALQVHGAIGYTEESDVHLWLKRAWLLADSYGGADEHRARVADDLLS
jgi:alkylation response protein AidB-like acyl-CoA dehydrogenase